MFNENYIANVIDDGAFCSWAVKDNRFPSKLLLHSMQVSDVQVFHIYGVVAVQQLIISNIYYVWPKFLAFLSRVYY
jgi:hypothetical protein